ncbi:hypothetical protein H257_11103 [Aphanomyces astaci]|uniref:Uncharacterized protein n=1 Tax=Aphanomyces astaci TaxID=112090 RepID=W4G5E1_APHAT|nr:hypothetical protein H257_11103 [Aphanomyces astaci]ETV74138.1 hypothetical protein H257_11103 [Aphanomyces astaci]|eukprot:XP_009836244.1 hypothetical protein H257_11103 [Aphanomyces astaci]
MGQDQPGAPRQEDDLAAGSYMLLTIHPDHLKYVQAATMTPDNRHVGSRLSNLRKRIRETFTDQFKEFTRKLTPAGDSTPESAHINRFLSLLPPHIANSEISELKLDDERQKVHDPNMARKAISTNVALMTTRDYHYCGKTGHFEAE